MKVLVAPDKFKGSLTAAEVASAVASGLADVHPGLAVRVLPVADGGDGTVDAAVAAGFRRVRVPARGPTGEPVTASYAVRGDTAVVELAEASGLHRLPGALAPLTATSAGTGDVLAAAVRAGCRRIVLGVGGSACTDGGAGMLAALGARLLDAAGRDLPPGGEALSRLASVDLSRLDLSGVDIELASDVDNPLYGPHGAASVYGPQKGASPGDVETLDAALRHWASQVGPEFAAKPGAGAAGGVGFAAMAVLGARMRPGIELLLDLLGFDAALSGAALVITGEGSLDRQTLSGKAPAGVARAAAARGIPCVAVSGRCRLSSGELAEAGISAAYALTDLEPDPARCMAEAAPLLRRLAHRVAIDYFSLSR
ncbi:Glycerate kinase (EC [Amycolatopsis camponoti]|uniref:Glycerate kinase (EC) n=1 Tax=Amycolatopsis camponoti TaxID=2606593 RepID=A0A6I8LPK6_9PSEU|nr:glycerate kinase [Amycolatopsis camponoti]VVJ19001.1 Glycerate kinase (EC [Amycolatopsis camponoti]